MFHTDVAVNKRQQNAQMLVLVEAFVSLFIEQHKLSVTPGGKGSGSVADYNHSQGCN